MGWTAFGYANQGKNTAFKLANMDLLLPGGQRLY
jgi:hypothetical protein